ncbi:hypothetical protein BA71_02022 [Acinetobacter baumannii LAC-4]|nr:hypothetical protein BA71_02022 [Acinetobacter baumannii LAC-4]
MEPLLLATHKRLEELEKSKAPANEPPSLMVQIQNAPDLTTLDALEIDVAARDPQIQSRLSKGLATFFNLIGFSNSLFEIFAKII